MKSDSSRPAPTVIPPHVARMRLRRRFARGMAGILFLLVAGLAVASFLLRGTGMPIWEILLWCVTGLVVLPVFVYLTWFRWAHQVDSILQERSEIEAQLRESQEQLENIIYSVIDPILAVDKKGLVVTGNPAVEKVFGWKIEELLGKNVNIIMGEPYRTEHDNYIRSYLEGGDKRSIGTVRKVFGRKKDGTTFPCEISISEVEASSNMRFVGIIRDVTERLELSGKLAQAERLAAVGELAAGVAHEINNPVNTILNCAQLIADGDGDPSLCQDILHEGNRIAVIVRGLLDFARERNEEFRPTDVGDVVERTLSLIQRRITKTGIDLVSDVPKGISKVRSRPHQLQQVLLNLLLNSRDALLESPPGDERPTIRVTAGTIKDAHDRPRVRIRVWDNGPGIPPAHLDRLFEPFFTTKRESGGTGLGLSVSHGIIESHGGNLYAASKFGKYTEMTIELPEYDEAGQDEERETVHGQDHGH